MKSAIIIAESAEERRAIVQFLKPAEMFSQIHFCNTSQEVDFLLHNSSIDMIFCDVYTQRMQPLPFSTPLIKLCTRYRLQLVFFSHLDPKELLQLDIIPAGAHCLSYESSPATATALLKHLLLKAAASGFRSTDKAIDNLIDSSTGAYNRFYFDTILDRELTRTRQSGRPFSLLLIEPERHVKATSANGPALLPALSKTIKEQIRTSDLLCRVERRRLALLLPETSLPNAQRVISRIQNKNAEFTGAVPVALRFGLAMPNQKNRFERHELLSEAEAAL